MEAREIASQVIGQFNLMTYANSHLSAQRLQQIMEESAQRFGKLEQTLFTLQHFRNALAHPDNQGAQRLIISGQGVSAMIVARTASVADVSKNKKEDDLIRKTLKRTLEHEGHRKDFVHELTSRALSYSSMLEQLKKVRPALSFEILKTIIQQADDAMAEIKLLQATRSLAPRSSATSNRTAARALLRSSIEHFFSGLGIQNEALAVGISAAAIPKSAEEIAAEQTAAAKQAAWEQSECERIMSTLISRGRNRDALSEHYREAEEAAIAAEALHNQAMQARRDAAAKEQFLAQARQFFEELKTALNDKRELAEFEESTLNKISHGANLASVTLGMFNVPFVSLQGIANAVSTFATLADQRLTVAQAKEAYQKLQIAIQQAEQATAGYEQLEEAANKMQAHAEALEERKRKEEYEKTMHLSKLVILPSDADDVALRQWATELSCEFDGTTEEEARTTAHLLYKQAKKNHEQIYELVSDLWGERLIFLQQELQRLAEQPLLDTDHQSAHKKEITAQTEALASRTRLEEAEQAKNAWLSKREQLRNEKKTLEDQVQTDAEHRAERQSQLEAKRRELAAHQTQKEMIDTTYQAAAEEARKLTLVATKARTEGLEKFKKFNSAKQFQARKVTRLQSAVEIEQKVLDEVLIAEAKRKEIQACEARNAKVIHLAKQAFIGAKVALNSFAQAMEVYKHDCAPANVYYLLLAAKAATNATLLLGDIAFDFKGDVRVELKPIFSDIFLVTAMAASTILVVCESAIASRNRPPDKAPWTPVDIPLECAKDQAEVVKKATKRVAGTIFGKQIKEVADIIEDAVKFAGNFRYEVLKAKNREASVEAYAYSQATKEEATGNMNTAKIWRREAQALKEIKARAEGRIGEVLAQKYKGTYIKNNTDEEKNGSTTSSSQQ